jgi:hypothetical protein
MAGYTRVDTINNIADGNVISAADLDGEFDGIQAAFNSSTGHNHDGTAGEGAPILALGPVQDVTISTSVLGVKTTNTVDLGTTGLRFKDFYLAGAASIGGTLGVTGATTLSAALTYGGVTLSNAVTGTGNMVLSISPTLTGTLTAAAANFSGVVALNGNITLGDADTDTITQGASYVTGTQLKSAKTATNTLSLAAYDTDGVAYTDLITLTASTTPTLTLTSTGVGTINNMSIGATTASTGAFTTLSATGNVTLGDAVADTITLNGQFVTGTVLRSAQAATNTLALAAYDVDGAAYTNLITLTASNTPTLALTSTGVGTINNMSIGATTTSTGAFTTLSATGAITFNTTTNAQSYTTTGAGTITISSGTAGTINNMSIGATTALAGTFTDLTSTGNTTIGNADTDTITENASYVTGTQLKSAKTATNTLSLAAYDTDGLAYTNLITLTASTTPTLALTSTGVGTINNMSIGATTPATGAFTTLSATGAITANTTANNQSYTTTGAGTITISSGTAGTINNMSIGATTALAGTFTNLSATGNVTLGDASTDTVTVNGYMGVGSAVNAGTALLVGSPTLTGTTQRGIDAATTFGTGATASVQQIRAISTLTTAGAYTEWIGLNVPQPQGTGYTLTNAYGLYISDQTKGTNNYGITSLVSSGTNKYNIYASGTADNYMAGNLGIGISPPVAALDVSGAPTGALSRFANTTAPTLDNSTHAGEAIFLRSGGTAGSGNVQAVLAFGKADGSSVRTGSAIASVQNTADADQVGIGFYTSPGTGSTQTLTQQMLLDYAGNVGIGTSSPAGNLQISGSGDRSLMVTGGTSGTVSVQLGDSAAAGQGGMSYDNSVDALFLKSAGSERMRIDSSGNVQVQSGAVMPYAPAPAAISAAATLTNANIQGQIISATGTTYTITMPLGTTMETLATWATTNIAYDFFVINTASGTVTMAVNTGVTSLGSLTIATGVSAHFRIRRTAANTFVLYRLV